MPKKTKIIINPKKEELMKETIRQLLQAELADLKEQSKKKESSFKEYMISYTYMTVFT